MSLLSRLLLAASVPVLVGLAWADPLETALASIRQHQVRAHLWFLSHDRLQGRAPGPRGGATSALYIASQFARAGVEPLGGSFLQQVPLVALTPVGSRTVATLARDGETLALEYGTQFLAWAGNADSVGRVDAELVFAGFGITAPEYDWDDFAGRDVRGKVLMVLVNDPPAPPEDPLLFQGRGMTYYGRWTYKIEEARRRGAAGVLIVHETAEAGYPWAVVRNSWSGERLALDTPDSAAAAVDVAAWITRGAADSALRLAGLGLDELVTRAARRDFAPIPTGIRIRMSVPSERRRFDAANVWGIVRGAHAERRNEVVVYTAHYDHLGVGRPVDGEGAGVPAAVDGGDDARPGLHGADAFGVFTRRGERLFDEDVLAGFHRHTRHLGVRPGRRDDGDEVDLRIRDEVLPAGVETHALRAACGVGIRHGPHDDLVERRPGVLQEGAEPSKADDTE